MKNALAEFIIEGIPTTIPFHNEIFEHPDFIKGDYDIAFLETRFKQNKNKDKK